MGKGRKYAIRVQFFLLSFRTLMSKQKLRDIARYNSDLLHWAVFVSSVPMLSKGLGSRQVFNTYWLDEITAAWQIQPLLVDTA